MARCRTWAGCQPWRHLPGRPCEPARGLAAERFGRAVPDTGALAWPCGDAASSRPGPVRRRTAPAVPCAPESMPRAMPGSKLRAASPPLRHRHEYDTRAAAGGCPLCGRGACAAELRGAVWQAANADKAAGAGRWRYLLNRTSQSPSPGGVRVALGLGSSSHLPLPPVLGLTQRMRTPSASRAVLRGSCWRTGV